MPGRPLPFTNTLLAQKTYAALRPPARASDTCEPRRRRPGRSRALAASPAPVVVNSQTSAFVAVPKYRSALRMRRRRVESSMRMQTTRRLSSSIRSSFHHFSRNCRRSARSSLSARLRTSHADVPVASISRRSLPPVYSRCISARAPTSTENGKSPSGALSSPKTSSTGWSTVCSASPAGAGIRLSSFAPNPRLRLPPLKSDLRAAFLNVAGASACAPKKTRLVLELLHSARSSLQAFRWEGRRHGRVYPEPWLQAGGFRFVPAGGAPLGHEHSDAMPLAPGRSRVVRISRSVVAATVGNSRRCSSRGEGRGAIAWKDARPFPTQSARGIPPEPASVPRFCM